MKCLKCLKAIEVRSFYGLHPSCFIEWFHLDGGVSFHHLELKPALSSSEPGGLKSSSSRDSRIIPSTDSFYHGKYKKYSARLGDTQYILKVQEEKYPDLPATEYLCNQIASILGLKVPEYYLIRYGDPPEGDVLSPAKPASPAPPGVMTFVTKNFMQNHKGGTLHHIYKFLPPGPKNYHCQNIINCLSRETQNPKDVQTFVKICLFDSFIGNSDRHGRNLGIIETRGSKKLAPLYDNPSLLGTEPEQWIEVDFKISGCIYTTCSKEPQLKDYVQEFKQQDLGQTCLKFLKKLQSRFPLMKEVIKNAFISEKRKQAFTVFLTKQLKSVLSFTQGGG